MTNTRNVAVPDIGDFNEVEIIEVLVRPGDSVRAEDPLLTLESDKASMDIPSPVEGVVQELKVQVGDKVSAGDLILVMELAAVKGAGNAEAPAAGSADGAESVASQAPVGASAGPPPVVRQPGVRRPPVPAARPAEQGQFVHLHASPTVRRFARELGVNLTKVEGRGRKGRVLKRDVQDHVKKALSQRTPAPSPAPGMAIPALPEVDFSKFGDVELLELPRIKKKSGPHLHRAWLNVPMVTHNDLADITDLEAFRKSLSQDPLYGAKRVTVLAFVVKAVAFALRHYPQFNASLTADAQALVHKKYVHIGIAVDTPHGLVVPVLRDVDRKSVLEVSQEMLEISARARDGKLKPTEMQGGCISISSLGGIGGTGFTPIVNVPEVAILGVTRARMRPLWDGGRFRPRLLLPLHLTYDHRAIDGAEGARFSTFLCSLLGDVRRLML